MACSSVLTPLSGEQRTTNLSGEIIRTTLDGGEVVDIVAGPRLLIDSDNYLLIDSTHKLKI